MSLPPPEEGDQCKCGGTYEWFLVNESCSCHPSVPAVCNACENQQLLCDTCGRAYDK